MAFLQMVPGCNETNLQKQYNVLNTNVINETEKDAFVKLCVPHSNYKQ